jgi:hypothetical protein
MAKVSKKDFLKVIIYYNKIRDILIAGLEIAEKLSNGKVKFISTEMFGFHDDTYCAVFEVPLSVTDYSKVSVGFRMTEKHIIKDILVKGNIEGDNFVFNSIDSNMTEVMGKFLNTIESYKEQKYSTRVNLPYDRGWFEVTTLEMAQRAQALVNEIVNLSEEKNICGSPELIAYNNGDMELFGMYFRDAYRTVYHDRQGNISGEGYATFRIDGNCDHFKQLKRLSVYISEGEQQFNGDGEDLLMPFEKLVEYLKPFSPYEDNLKIKYENKEREVIKVVVCDYSKKAQ